MPVTGDTNAQRFLEKEKSVTPPKRKRGAKPNPTSIAARARELGVTRQHLHLVLRGQRRSARLLRRYAELTHTESAK